MSRQRVAPRRGPTHRQHAPSAEARAALAEALLSAGDVSACAQAALHWLGRHAGIEKSLCAVFDLERGVLEGGVLEGIAGDGIPHAHVETFHRNANELDDPLVLALSSREVLLFDPDANGEDFPATPLGTTPFHAVPLDREELDGEPALGLLLLVGLEGSPGEDVRWAADLLSARLLCARYRGARAAERRAARERALLHGVINTVTDPIILTDGEGRMHFANSQAEALFAATDEGSEGRRRAVALNNMLLSASLFTATEHGGPVRRELVLVGPTEGQDLLFELLSSNIQDTRLGVAGVVSVLRDVRDLRKATDEIEENYRRLRVAEAEVRAERDRLDLVINAVADPVLVTDPIGNIVLMNPPAERIFTSDPPGATAFVERHIRANDVLFSSFVSNLYTMQALRWRGQLELADPTTGKALPFEAIAGKLISKQGEVAGVVTILHDRSEALEKARLYEQVMRHSEELEEKVREATAELSQQNELLRKQAVALEEASKLKSQFLANISHELRTPLNAIMGYTSLFLEGILGELKELQRDKLERVDANARHLVAVINNLLDLSRIESGRMPIHLESFSVTELVAEVMQEVEPLIARSRLTVTSDAAGDLPRLHSDRQKVKQILLNLLSNAIKFTPEGFVRVQCRYDEARGIVSLGVSDTGIGIPAEQQERIFEEFQQVDSSESRRYGGTGLGLAICKRLAGLLSGELDLVSRPGAGSTFTVHLPVWTGAPA